MERIKNDPARGFFCIDWIDGEPFEVYGHESEDDYQRLEVILLPCNYVHTSFGYEGDSVSPECIGDLDEQIKYLGAVNWWFYLNQERYNPEKYDEEKIERYSIMDFKQFD